MLNGGGGVGPAGGAGGGNNFAAQGNFQNQNQMDPSQMQGIDQMKQAGLQNDASFNAQSVNNAEKGQFGAEQKKKEQDIIKRLAKQLEAQATQNQANQFNQPSNAGEAASGPKAAEAANKANTNPQDYNQLKDQLLEKLQEKGVQVTPQVQQLVDSAMQHATQGGGGPAAASGVNA